MKRCSMVLLSLVTAVSLLSVSLIPAKAFSPSGSTIYKGIDVSVWDGDIDYVQVKNAGVEVVYMRAGEGNDVKDTTFEANYTGAKNNGLKIGFYYYVTATELSSAPSGSSANESTIGTGAESLVYLGVAGVSLSLFILFMAGRRRKKRF